ncbi:uncharacterized protein DUF4349 [Mucilaginibacter yixingensis]|uniref:Uncharacterized protein DUF4349 n=1 Tax=Mucilaginibacter yixingensis TaxID=1295612 RepID=A0A2T5JDM3_9SPHI|nr:DUF4349 domain-containing protein [Mucilaginibacter yixingensis]PTQ99870.1 uncharacterized protein DUF4349 [Mucilaginibacter yixingensis]
MKTRLIVPFVLLALAACKPTPDQTEAIELAHVNSAPPAAEKEVVRLDEPVGNADVKEATDDNQTTVQDTAKKKIHEGDITFRTKNITQTRSAILASLKAVGGYLASEKESTNESDSTRNYTLEARIPAKNFDRFLNKVTQTAVLIDSKNITTTDVTTRYIDMTTRLRNKKALEARYLELLHQSTRMTDILQVENKLNEIRTEIETTQGQLNYLNKQIAYSSLQITFYTKRTDLPVIDQTGNRLLNSLKDGWSLLQHLFFGLIAVWPLLLIGVVLVALFRRWRKRRRAQRLNNPQH